MAYMIEADVVVDTVVRCRSGMRQVILENGIIVEYLHTLAETARVQVP